MRDAQTFIQQRIRRRIISLLACKHACSEKSAQSRLVGSSRACELQQLAQPVPAFSKILARFPEAKQCRAQPQTPICVSGFCQPLKGGAEIVVFQAEAFEQFLAYRAALLGD